MDCPAIGHSTTEMLFRVYSRYVPNLTRRDGSAFERLLINNMSNGAEQTEHSENQTAPQGKEVHHG